MRLNPRRRKDEFCPGPMCFLSVLHGERSAVRLRDLLADREPQSQPSWLRRREFVEEAAPDGSIDSRPLIDYLHANARAIENRTYPDMSFWRGRIYSILQKIFEELGEVVWIAL